MEFHVRQLKGYLWRVLYKDDIIKQLHDGLQFWNYAYLHSCVEMVHCTHPECSPYMGNTQNEKRTMLMWYLVPRNIAKVSRNVKVAQVY